MFTPSETIYSQNHFISSEGALSLQDNVDKFINNFTASFDHHSVHIINIYKLKNSVMLWLDNGYQEEEIGDSPILKIVTELNWKLITIIIKVSIS